jgi:DNA-binding transcriptional regulator YdaS (Cro superfamily)
MELHAWLDANPGKAVWLAAQLGRSKGAVSLWREGGVPMELMPTIEKVTEGAVTTESMLKHAMACRLAAAAERAADTKAA